MIVNITQAHLAPSQLAFLQLLTGNDIVVCCADGVYAHGQLEQSLSAPICVTLKDDCLARGVDSSQSISLPELAALQDNHQQWISI